MKSKQSYRSKLNLSNELNLVSNFMGLPNDLAQPTSRHPLSMDKIVEKVWDDWGIGEEETLEKIISGSWHKIVGRSLSGKCAPINLSKDVKTLQIRAASSTVKQELSFKKAEILKKINSLRNCRGVKQIRII